MACVSICLACLLSVGLLPCSTTAATTEDSVYYVRPTDFQDASENCSIASEGQPCRTLNDYATDTTEDLFTLVSNARFLFLPGTHQLNVQVTVLLATNVTFTAYDEGHVVLSSTSSGEITCILCVNVEFSGFTFIVNTSSQSGQTFDAVMLYLSDSSTCVLSNLTFIGNGHTSTSALALMSSNVTIGNIQISSFVSSGGGAIMILNGGFIDFRGYNSFVNNTASSRIGGGGAIYLDTCTTKFYGTTVFTNNTSTRARGGALLSRNSDTTFYGNVTFTNNRAMSGGALSINGGSTNFYGFVNNASIAYGKADTCTQDGDYFEPNSGTAIFLNNSAQREGGAIDVGTGNLRIISGDMSFVNNAASSTGGAISTTPLGHIEIRSSSVNFTTNSASSKGGAVYILGGSAMCGRISFVQNRAESGGAVFISSTNANASIFGNILFEDNTATRLGGALRISAGSHFLSGNVLLTRNTATENGGAIYIAVGNFSILGNASFTHNSVTRDYGGAVAIYNNGVLNVTCNVSYFINNTANIYGGAIYNDRSTAIIGGNISFINNSARLYGGAIAVFASGNDGVLILTGALNFVANSVVLGSGGAVALFESPALTLVSPLQANFIGNSANQNGGAISFERLFTLPRCFSQSITNTLVSCPLLLSSRSGIELGFINNSAGSAGTALYGGEFDTCSISVGGVRDLCGNVVGGTRIAESATIDYIRSISSIVSNDSVTSDIASYPTMVCSCKTGQIVCPLSAEYNNIKLIRGQELTLQVATVGQGRGAVPSAVRINLQNNVQIAPSQRIQTTSKGCTSISYRLSGEMNTTMIKLAPDNSVCPSASIEVSVPITLNFLPCPDGFALRGPECTCEERLEQLNATCNVDDSSIERSSSNTFWIGALYINGTYEGLITHSRCPFDYCVDTPVNFTLDNVDAQCQHNHSGTLCGSCTSNLSTALGTLHCLPCSHSYLALILPFTLAGAALVAILLLLNLSVASGTLNGLIFYANIVQANHSDFFPPGETNILTVFIAWLNLDLGIETCFYDGMTTYAYTWLQFLFPFYVWFLIGLIIVASRYSIKISRSLGTNPVAVLSTLFLLSYSKLLRNIIAVLSLTRLELPAGATKTVWLYDGNVPYFQRADHIVLGIFSILVLVFLFLPFTLLLLFSQLLHKYSNWKVFSWINKLKPFLDAYHAPYKKETRYWSGLLLLVRCILFLQFAFNTSNSNSDINLIFIISFLAGLAVLSWTHSGIYDKLHNNIIEASLILNLIILASATGHVIESEDTNSQAAIAYTFVGIAFVTFISVLLYHVIISLRGTSVRRKLTKYVVTLTNRQKKGDKVDKNERGRHDQENIELNAVINPILLPHSTFTELRETLLASEKPD